MLFRSRRREPPAMTLEGALGPNDRLDRAPGLRVEAPAALCAGPAGRLLVASGERLLALSGWEAAPVVWAEFARPVTALAAGPSGLVAAGLLGGGIELRDAASVPVPGWTAPDGLAAVDDLAFAPDGRLLVVDGGYGPGEDMMALATWDAAARGRVLALSPGGGHEVLAAGLHAPAGICIGADGRPVVTLFERASVVDLSGKALQTGYPAYLGRIRRTAGGHAIACLSRRDPLIEFLKQEAAFVAEMKARLDPRHWIAPRATPEFSHEFPIELGASRLFGEVKPWAPSFSYGLVIETDAGLMPVASAHSRANGRRHSVCDVAEWNGRLVALSRASGELLDLGHEGARP